MEESKNAIGRKYVLQCHLILNAIIRIPVWTKVEGQVRKIKVFSLGRTEVEVFHIHWLCDSDVIAGLRSPHQHQTKVSLVCSSGPTNGQGVVLIRTTKEY